MLKVLLPFAVQRTLQAIAELRRSFPDYHGTNEIQVAEGDMVANPFVFYGTHQGEYMGVAPTGREVTFLGLTLDKVIDGKRSNREPVVHLAFHACVLVCRRDPADAGKPLRRPRPAGNRNPAAAGLTPKRELVVRVARARPTDEGAPFGAPSFGCLLLSASVRLTEPGSERSRLPW